MLKISDYRIKFYRWLVDGVDQEIQQHYEDIAELKIKRNGLREKLKALYAKS